MVCKTLLNTVILFNLTGHLTVRCACSPFNLDPAARSFLSIFNGNNKCCPIYRSGST
jgi:hypothetical protein